MRPDIELTASDCDDGDVRLVNGDNSLEGRLEVCFNGVWGQCAATALTLMMPEWCADSSPHSWKVSVRELCSWFEVRVVGFCDAEGVVLTGATAYGVGNGPVS